MTYEDLIETAKKIPVAGAKAISEYHKKSDFLVAAINHHMISRSDLTALIGKSNISSMKNNHANHVLFIHSILKNPNPVVLVDTLLWVFRTYRNHGFDIGYWDAQINGWFEIFKDHLSAETCAEIFPLYQWMLDNIPVVNQLSVINGEEKKTTA